MAEGMLNHQSHSREVVADGAHQQQPKEKAGILSVNQVELHPWLARPDIVSWCQDHGVVVEAYSPLVRSTRMEEPVLVSLAKKHGKTAAQILLRWGLQKGFVILPKSVTHSRIEVSRVISVSLIPSSSVADNVIPTMIRRIPNCTTSSWMQVT